MYDVIIVGYGPTGMLASIQLARAGLRVAVTERYKTLYNLPRVGIVHDDVLRMFQELGCIDELWPNTYFLSIFDLVRNGKVLFSSSVLPMATHGWPEYISIYQPAFEKEFVRLQKDVIDVEGRYNQLMDEYGCDVIVKRDDYHIFGAARTVGELPRLLSELRAQLDR